MVSRTADLPVRSASRHSMRHGHGAGARASRSLTGKVDSSQRRDRASFGGEDAALCCHRQSLGHRLDIVADAGAWLENRGQHNLHSACPNSVLRGNRRNNGAVDRPNALSASAVYAGWALAYSGATLPLNGANAFSLVWSNVLPLPHYIAVQMGQVSGQTLTAAIAPMSALAAYVIVAGGGAIALIAAGARRA